MAGLNDIKKQLEVLAQPFTALSPAAHKMRSICNALEDNARNAGHDVMVGTPPIDHLRAIQAELTKFDAALVELQAAIRGVMGSSVMDEYNTRGVAKIEVNPKANPVTEYNDPRDED